MKNREMDQRRIQKGNQSSEVREKEVRRMYARKKRRRKKLVSLIIEGVLFCLCLALLIGFLILEPGIERPNLRNKKAETTGTEMTGADNLQTEDTENNLGKAVSGDLIDINTLKQLIAQAKEIQTDSASQEDAEQLQQAIEEAEKAVNSGADETTLAEISLPLVLAMGNFE